MSSILLQRSAIYAFRQKVLRFYRKHGRSLPWRETQNPYHILVSEFMLQQTQVNRVIPYYQRFIRVFPSIKRLAQSSSQDVLRVWSGLGYNSRAIRLHQCAKQIVAEFGGEVPSDTDELQRLQGIGSYTAGAIAAFAYNRPAIFYDTNIRRVLIAGLHLPQDINKAEIMEVVAAVLPRSESREWYNALMDYGALKLTSGKTGIPAGNKQSAFKGSDREVRGYVMKLLLKCGSVALHELNEVFPTKNCTGILAKMIEDGLPLTISGKEILFLSRENPLKK